MAFPLLNESEIALLRSDPFTGIVLNDQFERHSVYNKEDIIYTVYNTLSEAKIAVDQMIKVREVYELTGYNYNEEVVFHISSIQS